MIVCTTETTYRYSGLSTDIKPVIDPKESAKFWETDTGKRYESRGGEWILVTTHVSVDENFSTAIYESGDTIYICTALPGTLLTAAKWQIKKFNTLTMIIQWAHGNANYSNVATDLATVAALPYS